MIVCNAYNFNGNYFKDKCCQLRSVMNSDKMFVEQFYF